MKTKLTHKIASVFTALVLALGTIIPATNVVHAAKDLEIAKYTSVSGTVSGAAGSNKGTYAGVWKAKVPMADVMSAFESNMTEFANKGYFPWDKETVSTSASIDYHVSFPDGAEIGTPVTNSTSEIIPKSTITKEISGKTVKFKLKLKEVNWSGILQAYRNDKAAGTANRTVDIEIPYTVKASSKSQAESFDHKNITAKGNFSFYPSSNLGKVGIGLQSFNSDTSTKPLTKGFANSNVFKAQENTVSQTVDLPADLKLDGNTGHQVITKGKNDNLDFEGVIDAKTIKDQMKKIEQQYSTDVQKIKLSNLTTSFTAKLNLPDGLSFVSTNPELSGANGSFVIESTTLENGHKTAVVKFKLVNAENMTSYTQLRDAIHKVADELKVTFKTVKFNEQARSGTDYEVTGSITGSLKAKVTNTISGKVVNFNLSWNGKQTEAGKSASNPNEIALSVKYQSSSEQTISKTDKLPGDLLVNGDTQHTKVMEFKKNDVFKVTGLLDVSPIKNTMHQLEAQYPTNPTNISVTNMKHEFTASMELPDGLKFVGNIKDKVTLEGANTKFKISEVTVNGKKLTVKMVLANPVNNFQDIKKAVDGVADQLKVHVDGVTFEANAEKGKNYTIKGQVSGLFSAKATNKLTSNIIHFNYKWLGEQLVGGEDFTNPMTKEITATVKHNSSNVGNISATDKLPSDLLVNGNTQHDRVYVAKKSDKMTMTGLLDVSSIKKRMRELEAQYGSGSMPTHIQISDLETSFTATMTLPNELSFAHDYQVELMGSRGKFEITKVTVNGKKITVTMKVVGNVQTFQQIKEAVEAVDDHLKVNVKGVVFNENAKPNTNYTIRGTVFGHFKAKATNTATNNVLHFDLKWFGEQIPEGADFIAPTSKEISLTLKYTSESSTPKNPKKPIKPGTNPRTGDSINLWMYVGLLVATLAGIGVLVVLLKRKD